MCTINGARLYYEGLQLRSKLIIVVRVLLFCKSVVSPKKPNYYKMECLNSLVTKNIPNYFAGLPIPATFGGWFKLGCEYKNKFIRKFLFFFLPGISNFSFLQ